MTSQGSQVEDNCSFPSLCPATFIAWYRVMVRSLSLCLCIHTVISDRLTQSVLMFQHEQNVATLNRVVSTEVVFIL